MTTISVVTPWHNHLELAEDYFAAVEDELQDGDEILVVDNASDERLPFARLRLQRNYGFCGGSNVGLNYAKTDAVLFLNNDVALVRRGWLNAFRERLCPGRLVGHLRNGRHTDVDGRSFPYLDGWCLAGMTQDLRDLGGFDESLEEPAYYSDNLLCLDARARGYELVDIPQLGIRHLENVTAGSAWNPTVYAATTANRARYQARARELLVAS